MEYSVNGKTLRYEPSNEVLRGDNVVLLSQARDLTQGRLWHKAGFSVEKLFDHEDDFADFISACKKILYRCWREAGLNVPAEFPLEKYHILASDQAKHFSAIEKTRLLSLDDFPIAIRQITDRVATILNAKVEGRNPYDNHRLFHFRVVRPCSGDNNPLHRDVWLEDYSDCINLYIPIAGSNSQSSLILLPGSHLWPESGLMRTAEGAVIDGVRFNVPAVTSIDGDYKAIRPDPGTNEFLLFSPYLIHGGATNFNEEETRISIELRLWPV
jgi:ectoine hydroxylase-related dioxygenase (phytanoyl-CoA dioxygenase family)